MQVLLVKLSSMGDIIHVLPALTDAKKAIPSIQFDWVIEPAFAEIPCWHTAVNHVIPMALRHWRKHLVEAIQKKYFSAFYKHLVEKKYDLIIDAQGLIKSAIVSKLARGTCCGYNTQSAKEKVASYFYSKQYAINKNQHAIMRARELFSKALQYDLPDTVPDYQINLQKLPSLSFPIPKQYVVFLHGTTRPMKYYSEKYWKTLIEKIEEKRTTIFLPWGNESEKMRAERLSLNHSNAIVLPKLNIAELGTLLKNAMAVVAVDTGLGHLSAALSTPTISLYGPTDPKRIGTIGYKQIHLQAEQTSAEIDIHPDKIMGLLDILIT